MRRAIIELRGCASYRKGTRLFVKDIPQVVEGDQSIAYFRGREEFSVREITPVAEAPVVEPEVEADDVDLPPPAEQGELAIEAEPVIEKTPAKRKVVKKRS